MTIISLAIVAGERFADTVAGLLDIATSLRPHHTVNVAWFRAPPGTLAGYDALAFGPDHAKTFPIEGRSGRPLSIGIGAPGDDAFGVPDLALFQPVTESPTRRLERITVLADPLTGLSAIPTTAMTALADRWEVMALVDHPEHIAGVPQGIAHRLTPRGRQWSDIVAVQDLVIAPDRSTALLANAMLKPAVVLADFDDFVGDDFPFVFRTSTLDLVARIEGYDADQNGPSLVNWKRGRESMARATLDAWLRSAGV